MDAGKVADLFEERASMAHGWLREALQCPEAEFSACPEEACVKSREAVAELRAEAAWTATTAPKLLCVISDCLRPRSPSLPWCERHATGAGRSA